LQHQQQQDDQEEGEEGGRQPAAGKSVCLVDEERKNGCLMFGREEPSLANERTDQQQQLTSVKQTVRASIISAADLFSLKSFRHFMLLK
jgi:hypothetical protein